MVIACLKYLAGEEASGGLCRRRESAARGRLELIHRLVRSCLPDYMVPASIVAVFERIPSDTELHLDRNALPAPEYHSLPVPTVLHAGPQERFCAVSLPRFSVSADRSR